MVQQRVGTGQATSSKRLGAGGPPPSTLSPRTVCPLADLGWQHGGKMMIWLHSDPLAIVCAADGIELECPPWRELC